MAEESLIPDGGEGGEDAPTWQWADGVPGEGLRPDWHAEKFKTVEAQARAYPDLEKRFGSLTGAPPIEGDQVHGYAMDNFIPEALELSDEQKAALLEDDVFISTFLPKFQEMNVNQEAMDSLAQTYFAMQQDAQEQADAYKAEQLRELGDNAARRLQNVGDYLNAQLPEGEAKALRDALSSAAGVMALEKIIAKAKGTRLSETNEPPATVTMAEIETLQMATDEHGNRKMNDPEYAKMVREKIRQVAGP